MTDLRNLTIISVIGRLNTLIDEGRGSELSPTQVKGAIADSTILDRLRSQYGSYPEFSPTHEAEAILLQNEWRSVMHIYRGREEQKMGVSNNGLCLLVGYCIEILMQRNMKELIR